MSLYLSPLVSRIVAVGLAVLLVLVGLQLFSALVGDVQDMHDRLNDARDRRVQLEAKIDRGMPERGRGVASGLYIHAKSANGASTALAAYVTALARQLDVQVRGMSPAPANSRIEHGASVVVTLDGKETAVIKLIHELEQGPRLTRLAEWHIAKASGGDAHLVLNGRVDAAWGAHP